METRQLSQVSEQEELAAEAALSAEEKEACDAINPPGSVVSDFHNTAPWMRMRVRA